jgi:hypothetical protein
MLGGSRTGRLFRRPSTQQVLAAISQYQRRRLLGQGPRLAPPLPRQPLWPATQHSGPERPRDLLEPVPHIEAWQSATITESRYGWPVGAVC